MFAKHGKENKEESRAYLKLLAVCPQAAGITAKTKAKFPRRLASALFSSPVPKLVFTLVFFKTFLLEIVSKFW